LILPIWQLYGAAGEEEAKDFDTRDMSRARTAVDPTRIEGSHGEGDDNKIPSSVPPFQEGLFLAIRFGPGLFQERFTPVGRNCFRVWINGNVCHLTAFTTSDDKTAKSVTARQLQNEIHSEHAFKQIQDWLGQCAEHKTCPRLEAHELDGIPGKIRLLVTNGRVDNYLALSYCWGGVQDVVTTLWPVRVGRPPY
jgi:hypothetical protein